MNYTKHLKPILRTTLLGLTQIAMAGEVTLPDFDCENKTIAVYRPGPRWTDLSQSIETHMIYIAEKLNSKLIESAGPTLNALGEPDGGISLYNSNNFDLVKESVENDPLIKNRISNYELKTWRICNLKQ